MKKVRFNNLVNVKYYSPNKPTKKYIKMDKKSNNRRLIIFLMVIFVIIVSFIFINGIEFI